MIHYSNDPFIAICGADDKNQSTTNIIANTDCLQCLRKALIEEQQYKEHLQFIIDLQRKSYLKAAKKWKEETGQENIWPDLTKLLFWFIQQLNDKEKFSLEENSRAKLLFDLQNQFKLSIQEFDKVNNTLSLVSNINESLCALYKTSDELNNLLKNELYDLYKHTDALINRLDDIGESIHGCEICGLSYDTIERHGHSQNCELFLLKKIRRIED